MPESLQGKTALVTGGAKRVGRALTIALARAGANVVIHHREAPDAAQALSRELAECGAKSWVVEADFTDAASCATLIDRARAAAGRLDILINSAAAFPADRLADVTFERLTEALRVNAWAPFELSRSFARQADKGKIVNLLDTRIEGYDWAHVAYIAGKHLLALFTRMTALEYAPHITVNAIAPGLILPPAGQDEAYLDTLAAGVPLRCHGGTDDVVHAAMFLLESTFITGQVVYVDGGRHLGENDGPHPD